MGGNIISKSILLALIITILGAAFLAIVPSFFRIDASHIVFNENFNDPGSLNNWVRVDDPDRMSCSSQWKIKDGMVGISIEQGNCTTNLMPKDSFWNNLGDNYIIELDMKFVRGIDHNIAFRFTPSTPSNDWYDLHFQSSGDFVLERVSNGNYNVSVSGNYPNSQTYHLKIIVNFNNIKVYVNSNLVKDYTSFTDRFPTGRLALRAGTGSYYISETYFDNIVVTGIHGSLDVPILKQTSDPWQSQVYNRADLWSSDSPTVKAWGCALVSAAMVLKYHGINKLPDGTGLDPGTLNSWLKNQSDGYIGDGLINWLAISRLSKQAKSVNNITAFDALEYRRLAGGNKSILATDILDSHPGILEQPGHFIVAKGINSTTFDINDPFYDRATLNDGYSNTFLSLGRYIPSNTNLSYIMLTVNSSVDILVASSSGKTVGGDFFPWSWISGASYYIQKGITNPLTGKSSAPIKVIIIPTPVDDSYTVSVATKSDGVEAPFTLKFYRYTATGAATLNTISGSVRKDEEMSYSFSYSQNPQTEQPAPVDITAPQMRSAEILDKSDNGWPDTIRVKFVRDINGATVNSTGSDFEIAYKPIKADEVSPGVVDISFEEGSFEEFDTFSPVFLKGDGLGTNSYGVKDAISGKWNKSHSVKTVGNAPPGKPIPSVPAGDYLVPKTISFTFNKGVFFPIGMFYTLDGTDPRTSASRIPQMENIKADKDITIKIVSRDRTRSYSEVVTLAYGIAPKIHSSSVAATASANSFSVAWITDRPAKSRVVFGKQSKQNIGSDSNYGYEKSTIEDGAMVTDHLVTISNLEPGVTYYYRALSRGSPEQIGEEKTITLSSAPVVTSSSSSNSVLASGAASGSSVSTSQSSIASCDDQKPNGVPKITSATPGINSVSLSWEEPEGPLTYYLISYGLEPGTPLYGNPNIGQKGTRSFTIENLSGGTKYYFRIRSGNGCMPGDYSDEVLATPVGLKTVGEAVGFEENVLGEFTQKETSQTEADKELFIQSKTDQNAKNLDFSSWYFSLAMIAIYWFIYLIV